MPRRKSQVKTESLNEKSFFDLLNTTELGERDKMAVQCADVLKTLAKARVELIGDQATPENRERVKRALAGVEASMKSEGLGFVGRFAHDLLVAMLDSVDRRDFGFLRKVADALAGDGLPADPVRHTLLMLATGYVRPGQSIFEAVADVPVKRVVEYLKTRGYKVGVEAVRVRVRELSGVKKPPGRHPKNPK